MMRIDMEARPLNEHIEAARWLSSTLVKRVKIPVNSTTRPEQMSEMMQDPWSSSGKYGLGWVYFGLILVLCTTCLRLYNYWGDKVRIALHKEEAMNSTIEMTPDQYRKESPALETHDGARQYQPEEPILPRPPKRKAPLSSIRPIKKIIALLRFVLYRPIPPLRIWKWKFTFPSIGVVAVVTAGSLFSLLYCLLPQPLFFSTMTFGSPPLAIRAGMLSVALLPWVVALSSKVNIISFLTGIGAERLIVLHRWSAYMCIALAIIHAVPFWWQSTRDPIGFEYFKQYFDQSHYIFSTGIAAIVPLIFLFLHSLPLLRHKAHEAFVVMHIPVSWLFIGLMFWHCHNYLTSWAYLYSTIALLLFSFVGRSFYLNWSNPSRRSWLIGEESSVTILPENAIKITIPTQKRWRPGQYAYIRMPGIALLDNHPFTIASLCSEDFPSDYGDDYRDMTLVFRPFGGFTRRVLDTAISKGPLQTYQAFIEGPYGGMRRQISSFDQVIFFAGGSGITAIASQLLDLIKRMREGKAITTRVVVIWAMKRPEIMSWFKEELRICREFAPPGSFHCNFYITSSMTTHDKIPASMSETRLHRLSARLGEKVDGALHDIATKRASRSSEVHLTQDEVGEGLTALPQVHLAPPRFASSPVPYFPPPPPHASKKSSHKRNGIDDLQVSTLSSVYAEEGRSAVEQPAYPELAARDDDSATADPDTIQPFDFGFDPSRGHPYMKEPNRLSILQKTAQSLLDQPPPYFGKRADLRIDTSGTKYIEDVSTTTKPSTLPPKASPYRPLDCWRTKYGRPEISVVLHQLSKDFGRRTCVFVCGPPQMRVDVARTIAQLQTTIWHYPDREELFLHTENYEI